MATPLIGPDGKRYVVDRDEDLQGAIDAGYRVETAEAPQTLGESAKGIGSDVVDTIGAGAQGIAKGLTAGLSDLLIAPPRAAPSAADSLDPSGDIAASRRAAAALDAGRLRKENPVVFGVGEFGGMVASPINKIGAAVRGGIGATTALGRIGASALAEGAEGLLYGAGNTMSEAALGDQDLTAEKMIAGIGLGGVLGVAGGGVGAGLAEGFKAVAPKIGRLISGAKGPIEEFAENRWLKAGGGIQSDIKKIPEAERAAVANVIREAMTPAGKLLPDSLDDAAASVASEREAVAKQLLKEVGVDDAGGLLPKMDKDEALAALDRGFKQNGDRIGAVLDQADQIGATPVFSGALKRFDDLETGLNPAQRDIIAGDLKNARKYILEMGNAPAGSGKNSFKAMNSLKSTLQDDINWADSGAKNNLKKKLVGIIRDELDTQLEAQFGQKVTPQIAASLGLKGANAGADLFSEFVAAKKAYGALKNAAKAVKGKNATGADAIAALVKDAQLAAPNLGGKLSALDHASNLIKHGLDRQLGNRFISPSDYAVGIAGGLMNPLGALAALPAAIAHKIIREKGPAIIAKLADGIAASPRLQMAAASFGKQLQTAAPNLGEYAAPLLQAYANSPATGLATHMMWAQANPDYAEKAQIAGFLPETPEEQVHADRKGDTLAAVASTLDSQNTEISKHLEKVFKGERAATDSSGTHATQDFGSRRMRAKDTATAHRKRVDEIRELAANPEALLDRVTANMGDLSELAPGVAGSMTKTVHAAVSYLAKESQEPQKAGPLAKSWVASSAETHEFAQKLEVVERPLAVLEHAAAGTLVPAQMDAVRAVYPLLARQIEDMAMERLTDPPKDVPYRSRLMLSMITGIDVDGSMGPAIALNQAAINSAVGKPSERPPTGGGGTKSTTLGKRMAPPGERRSMEE